MYICVCMCIRLSSVRRETYMRVFCTLMLYASVNAQTSVHAHAFVQARSAASNPLPSPPPPKNKQHQQETPRASTASSRNRPSATLSPSAASRPSQGTAVSSACASKVRVLQFHILTPSCPYPNAALKTSTLSYTRHTTHNQSINQTSGTLQFVGVKLATALATLVMLWRGQYHSPTYQVRPSVVNGGSRRRALCAHGSSLCVRVRALGYMHMCTSCLVLWWPSHKSHTPPLPHPPNTTHNEIRRFSSSCTTSPTPSPSTAWPCSTWVRR